MTRREIHSWLMDMDGVLVREEQPIPGADRFLAACAELELPFLVLTNNSIYTPATSPRACAASGLEVPEESIWTSALATARFLDDQRPGGSAFVIGEAGPDHRAARGRLHADRARPDYVVLGETRTYSFERITQRDPADRRRRAVHRDEPRPDRPGAEGPLPATGAVAALISRATGVEPYFVGKPNPLMMRSALNAIDAHSETTAMVGDRMDTDVVAGIEAGLETILVLTGVTAREEASASRTARRGSSTRSPTSSTSWASACCRALRDHGNPTALEAVLAQVEPAAPDLVVVGGDAAAGPLPGETLDRLPGSATASAGDGERRSTSRGRLRPRRARRMTCEDRSSASTPGPRSARCASTATCSWRFERVVRSPSPARPRCSERLASQRQQDHNRVTPRGALAPMLDGVARGHRGPWADPPPV